MAKKEYTGINIQFPISQLIVSGEKTIETRTYPIPEKFIEKELLLIETPGKSGTFKARILGTVIFGKSFKYNSKRDFNADYQQHKVASDSIWQWTEEKPKWGWPIKAFTPLKKAIPAPAKKGIKYTTNITL